MSKRKYAFIRNENKLTEAEMMHMHDIMSDEDTDDSVKDKDFEPSSEGKIATIYEYIQNNIFFTFQVKRHLVNRQAMIHNRNVKKNL